MFCRPQQKKHVENAETDAKAARSLVSINFKPGMFCLGKSITSFNLPTGGVPSDYQVDFNRPILRLQGRLKPMGVFSSFFFASQPLGFTVYLGQAMELKKEVSPKRVILSV